MRYLYAEALWMSYYCSGFEWKAVTLMSCPGKLCLDGLDLGEDFDVVADHFTEIKLILSGCVLDDAPFLPAVLVSIVLPDTSLCVGTTIYFSMLQNVIWSPPKSSSDENFMFLCLLDEINTGSKRTQKVNRKYLKTCSFKSFIIVYWYCCEVSS